MTAEHDFEDFMSWLGDILCTVYGVIFVIVVAGILLFYNFVYLPYQEQFTAQFVSGQCIS